MASTHDKNKKPLPEQEPITSSHEKILADLDRIEKQISSKYRQAALLLSTIADGDAGEQEAAVGYHNLSRGRYVFLNQFMEDMQTEPSEIQNLTKSEEIRFARKLAQQREGTKYIVGAFLGGTALCVGAAYLGWLYTKHTLKVKDGHEYSERMKEITPSYKDELQQGSFGRFITSTKEWMQTTLSEMPLFKSFQNALKSGFGDIQQDIHRRPSAGFSARTLSGSYPKVDVQAIDRKLKESSEQ
ncbi:hypothetical protein GUITHDRAFT_148400 [Guillardia theta CCMP2712]|uniref:Transmembrane protein n=1 Tax=Guillardia theta (strain CCMP2712) TaxID=905079 RepID=L1I948_GUITC|nr:hypothetical protein GUITHDRAFT_148400 [Guillardia theta CCMP2712]EKX32766.1 hypothetical protein GUITHDRAFT_148400 [Guillardia theta CCMP2712]|eukprot:XP_005819746.1 hypothetical protein GUITHDRAFT_148400 [Guillardia theta CCMP2712]